MGASFFRMLSVVTGVAQADQVTVFPYKLWKFFCVLDVVHFYGFYRSAISFAELTFISVPPQNCSSFLLPACTRVIHSVCLRHRSTTGYP